MAKSAAKAKAKVAKSKPAKAVKRPTKGPARGAARKPVAEATPYHHGALRDALLAAAERILERDGLAGLTLRAAAREAGVSHAAPTHHFGDLAGLVSELAAIGFRRFHTAMTQAAECDGPPLAKAVARARAYLAYARAHPGMYLLMFRTERLDMQRPALREAANAAFAGLAGAIGTIRGESVPDRTLSLDQAAEIVRAWSLVHGYTTLLLDGRLSDILNRLPAGTDPEALFGAMLMSMVRPPG